jgi:hypothetical protein
MRVLPALIVSLVVAAGCLDAAPPSGIDDAPIAPVVPELPGKMAWRSLTPGPQPRAEVCAANVDHLFYVIGGFFNPSEQSLPGTLGLIPWDMPTARADVYDVKTDSWTPLPDVPVPTIDHCNAIGYSGWVYLFHSSGNWKIQPPANQWIAIADWPNNHNYGGYGEINGKFYFAGGGSSKVDAYDPSTDTWETFANEMPTARDHTSGAALDGKLFVVAGDTAGHDVNTGANEIFDPATGNWTKGADLPVIRGSLHSVAYRGHIVTMGGQSGGGGGIDSFDDVHAYNPVTDTWTELPRMNTPRHGFGAGVYDDRIYAFHGSPQQGVDATAKADTLEPVP